MYTQLAFVIFRQGTPFCYKTLINKNNSKHSLYTTLSSVKTDDQLKLCVDSIYYYFYLLPLYNRVMRYETSL